MRRGRPSTDGGALGTVLALVAPWLALRPPAPPCLPEQRAGRAYTKKEKGEFKERFRDYEREERAYFSGGPGFLDLQALRASCPAVLEATPAIGAAATAELGPSPTQANASSALSGGAQL